MARIVVLILAFVTLASPAESQTTVWVSATEGDDGGEGTSADEFATISRAVEVAITAGGDHIIKVREGDYTQAHELTSSAVQKGYPLALEDNIVVEGAEEAEIDFPRIGGDIENSDTRALFVVDATLEGRANIEVRGLHFVQEDTPDMDAPSAFLLSVADDRQVQNVSFVGNLCDRPAQNESGHNGRASVVVVAAPGVLTNTFITDNKIQASNRGGIEVIVDGQSADSVGVAGQLARNRITVPSAESALFGIRWAGSGDASETGFIGLAMNDNEVLGAGGYLTTGIEIRCSEGSSFGHGETFDGNEVRDCTGNGVVLRADGVEGTGGQTEISFNGGASRNIIVGNGGSGIVLWWDELDHQDGAGSIHFRMEGNIVADNGDYGILLRGLGPGSEGTFQLVNDTVADNSDGGLGFEDTLGTSLPIVVGTSRNAIVYGNGDADQVFGLGSTMLSQFFGQVSYSNWYGIPSLANGNIDDDPELDGNFHLGVSSPSVDKGRVGGNVTASVDIDGEDRVQDGNGDVTAVIDQGADELPAE